MSERKPGICGTQNFFVYAILWMYPGSQEKDVVFIA
jgi:hypothetical protein